MDAHHERLLSIMYALIRKRLLIQQIMIILGGGVALLVRAPRSGHKISTSMLVQGINANYLTGTLCGVEN